MTHQPDHGPQTHVQCNKLTQICSSKTAQSYALASVNKWCILYYCWIWGVEELIWRTGQIILLYIVSVRYLNHFAIASCRGPSRGLNLCYFRFIYLDHHKLFLVQACHTKAEYEEYGASICRTNPVFKGMYWGWRLKGSVSSQCGWINRQFWLKIFLFQHQSSILHVGQIPWSCLAWMCRGHGSGVT